MKSSFLICLAGASANDVFDIHPLLHILGDHDEQEKNWEFSDTESKRSIWRFLGLLENLIDNFEDSDQNQSFGENIGIA